MFGDKPLAIRMVCPQIRTAVLKWFVCQALEVQECLVQCVMLPTGSAGRMLGMLVVCCVLLLYRDDFVDK